MTYVHPHVHGQVDRGHEDDVRKYYEYGCEQGMDFERWGSINIMHDVQPSSSHTPDQADVSRLQILFFYRKPTVNIV